MRITVLISGSGSNLQALIDACASGRIAGRIVRVVSNRKAAFGLERATRAGIPTTYHPKKAHPDRIAYDAALAEAVRADAPDLIVLAGWMHILSPAFLDRFPGRVINLHPALPGQFPGKQAVVDAFAAWQAGAITHTGIMVHQVVPEVDAGPVLATAVVPIDAGDTIDDLYARIHQHEHRLLVDAVAAWRPPQETPMTDKRALLSVWDKAGLEDLGRQLVDLGYALVASGGTAKRLAAAGLAVTSVESVTGFPHLLGGRVKTLHPAIHGGILARRTQAHLGELAEHGLAPIDVVVCNLYPFSDTVAEPGCTEGDAIEQIDIGGVTLLRAAAKNFDAVTVVSDPADYPDLVTRLATGGADRDYRRSLALKAFRQTAAYDTAISGWLTGPDPLPPQVTLAAEKVQSLRYGENPHQQAALYRWIGAPPAFEQVQGKALSYNNLVDLDAAWAMPQDFDRPAVAIIKHTNPCGLAVGDDPVSAFQRALECDPVSAFGSIIAVNRTVDAAFVEAVGTLYVEVLAAPDFTPEALENLARRKKNCRVMKANEAAQALPVQVRNVVSGLLVQTRDTGAEQTDEWRVVTARQPTAAERADLEFAWTVVPHVKSNAILFTKGGATIGIGAGQMNRVQSVRLAAEQAGEKARGAVMASDAFFPFPDNIEAAAKAGITAVIQPGGSIRDDVVIAACDRLGLAMICTGRRHFRH